MNRTDTKLTNLAIPLTRQEIARLDMVAAQRGLSTGTLVRSWIDAGFGFSGLGTGPSQDAADSDLAQLRRQVSELAERLGTIESALRAGAHPAPATNGSSTPDAANGHDGRRRAGSKRARRGAGRRGPGLHDEIVAVLAESDQPMKASAIAEAIRRRGRYQAPRSGKGISGAMVSSRVSNPAYRDLFRRADRKIALKAEA